MLTLRSGLTSGAGAVLVALSVTACQGAPGGTAVQRSDSAGITIVTSPGESVALDWRLDPVFSLGGAETGPQSFYRVAATTVGADTAGHIYVLDGTAFHVVVFDSLGGFLREMGGKGGGPGEFKDPESISVTPAGDVAVRDWAKGGLVRFGPRGEVLTERALTIFPMPNRQRYFALLGGDIVVAYAAPTEAADEGLRARLARLTYPAAASPRRDRAVGDTGPGDATVGSGGAPGPPDTVVLAQIRTPAGHMALYAECGVGLNLPPLFHPELVWDVRGGTIAVNATAAYVVDLYRSGGGHISIRRAIPPRPATRALAMQELGEGMKINVGGNPCTIPPGKMVDERGFASTVPAIGAIALSPAGRIWVQRRVVGEGVGAIDVFDPDGDYRGTFPAGTPFPVVFLSENRIGTVQEDEVGVQRLRVWRIERPS